jgi:small-conductance mechanosensitive channel
VHILTKIFVVIATFLSIALSMLVIAYATNVDRVRADYAQETARRVSAEASASSAGALRSSESARFNATVTAQQTELEQVRGQLATLQAERAELQVAKNQAEANLAASNARINQQAEQVKTAMELQSKANDELTTLRANELRYRTRALESEQTINDLTSANEVLNQNYRALQEELAILKRDVQGAAAGAVSSKGIASKPFEYTGALISGRVESVERDIASGKNLAKLSIGANDRVSKNMLLRVVRDNQFIGNIVIEQTDLSFSIGAFDSLNLGSDLRAGDLVVSRLQ